MKKNYLFLLFAILCFAGKASAQAQQALPIIPCKADEMTQRLHAMDPHFLQAQKDYYEKQMSAAVRKIDLSKFHPRIQTDQSGDTSFWYDIPVVMHIIHDYNANVEYLSDNFIFDALNDWNTVYAKQNSDTSDVIAAYKGFIPNSNKRYIGNPHIRLHLASIDPYGNPTHGITRHRSYLTYVGGDQSKLDDWSPSSYVNIWSVNQMNAANGFAAAYAYWPSEAASIPYYDGIICLSSYVDQGGASSPGDGNSYKTINHEMGHVFNLLHPWGATNVPNPVAQESGETTPCGDDNVDDTPPTKGHYVAAYAPTTANSVQNGINDTSCAVNYYVIYSNVAGGDSLVNYPDTTNVQNIMDYSYIAKMFTYGQVTRMHAALNSTVANRSNLWDTTNLQITGVWDASYNPIPRIDLKPIPEFSASKGGISSSNYASQLNYFVFPGNNVEFYNESWNDTITNLTWTFSNGATLSTSNSTTLVVNSFTQPGWVTLSMAATGNHTADPSIAWDTTVTWPRAVFVANTTGTPGRNILEDFSTADTTNWPFFNYYGNQFKWQIANVGMYDNFSLEYTGFDTTVIVDPATNTYIYPVTGIPTGDIDDFFSIPVDLSGYTPGNCSLNFYYSGASRSSNSLDNTDTLEIDYSIEKGNWTKLTILSKGSLDNMGSFNTPYTPTSLSDWSQQSISIPAAALTNYTTFRFQYRPGVGQPSPYTGEQYSSGNNFYMDRISFGAYPASIGNVNMNNSDMAVVPNPTSGDAYVILKDAGNGVANIVVTDITGKVVYTVSQQITGATTQIEIPHTAISVKGMYIVQSTTGGNVSTQKLVVY